MSKVTIQIIQQDCHDEPDYGEILLFCGDDVCYRVCGNKLFRVAYDEDENEILSKAMTLSQFIKKIIH